ncbi:MAG: DUF7305 domain-containing protein [Planctomycetota bacterium]|jgi:hypothetical protein
MAAIKRLLRLKRRGSALGSALSISAVLFVIGTGMLGLGLHSQTLAIRTGDEIEARCAADAGLIKAIFEMNEKLEVQPWDDSTLPEATDEALPNCDATFSYTVTEDDDGGFAIVATGKSGRAESTKEVSCTLKLQGLFESVVAVKENIVLKPGSVVDGYNFTEAGEKLQIATLSTLPMHVVLGNGALVDGDVAVGVGGDPDLVICGPGATITGDTYALTKDIQFASVTVPQWLDDLPSGGTIRSSTVITSSGKYDGISIGRGKIITIDGPVTLYITGNMSLANSAQIQINNANPDAYLTLYMGGDLYCKNGGAINNLTEDPQRLKMFGLDTCVNLSFATTGTFYGAIYAPNAMVNLKNSVEIFGAISAKCLYQGLAANFHYDASLRDVSVNDEYVHFVIEKWRE